MSDNNVQISKRFLGLAGDEYEARRSGGEFSRRYQVEMYFRPYAREFDTVMDVGCGDGLSLRSIPARRRIGIEVNEAARRQCRAASARTGVEVELHPDMGDIADDSVDFAISNHCLEHTLAPFSMLSEVKRVLKPDCRLVIVVPNDDWRSQTHRTWKPDDPDNHLYTWSPRNFGNLLTEVGFFVEQVKFCRIAVSGKLRWVHGLLGDPAFRTASYLLALHKRKGETFAVARKPK